MGKGRKNMYDTQSDTYSRIQTYPYLYEQYDTFWDEISFKRSLVKNNTYLGYIFIM